MFMVLYTKDTNVSKLLHLVFLFFSQKKKYQDFLKVVKKGVLGKYTDTRIHGPFIYHLFLEIRKIHGPHFFLIFP